MTLSSAAPGGQVDERQRVVDPSASVFQSDDFGFASDAFVQVIHRVEILDSETFEPLVPGEFRGVSASAE